MIADLDSKDSSRQKKSVSPFEKKFSNKHRDESLSSLWEESTFGENPQRPTPLTDINGQSPELNKQ